MYGDNALDIHAPHRDQHMTVEVWLGNEKGRIYLICKKSTKTEYLESQSSFPTTGETN
jgi:hypothetical protein